MAVLGVRQPNHSPESLSSFVSASASVAVAVDEATETGVEVALSSVFGDALLVAVSVAVSSDSLTSIDTVGEDKGSVVGDIGGPGFTFVRSSKAKHNPLSHSMIAVEA